MPADRPALFRRTRDTNHKVRVLIPLLYAALNLTKLPLPISQKVSIPRRPTEHNISYIFKMSVRNAYKRLLIEAPNFKIWRQSLIWI